MAVPGTGGRRIILAAVAVWAAAGLLTLGGVIGLAVPPPEDTGFHHWELFRQASRPPELFRWTAAPRSITYVEVAGDRLIVPLRVAGAALPPAGVAVDVRLGGAPLGRVRLLSEGARRAVFYVPPALGSLAAAGGTQGDAALLGSRRTPAAPASTVPPRRVPLELVVSDSHVPARRPGESDLRRLGVAVGDLEWRRGRPGGALGVHAWETDPEGRDFRWTGEVASFPVVAGGERLVVSVRASHPDLARRPVVVEVLWDGDLLGVVRLTEGGWRTVELAVPAAPGDAGVVTLRVDRTWNPREAGGANDPRDLGVALTEIEWR